MNRHNFPFIALALSVPLAIALVFGSEGRGARQLTRETCDHMASLPMMGRLGSLNVGASVAAMTYEVQRQRAAKPCV